MRKLLYHKFITCTIFSFSGIDSWMSCSWQWWYQSFKYGNDLHVINVHMHFEPDHSVQCREFAQIIYSFFWFRCHHQTNFQHQINHLPFQLCGRYHPFLKLVLRMSSGFIHLSRYVYKCSIKSDTWGKMVAMLWTAAVCLYRNCKYW